MESPVLNPEYCKQDAIFVQTDPFPQKKKKIIKNKLKFRYLQTQKNLLF